jgi:hemerythrin
MPKQEKIKKISVARGVFWVEIPDVGLRILCGCPMDSVKHLMKRGLIIQTEKQGVVCETGPNAILLSDIMLQNGEFSNLGEFPVLQMLYKQGLIIPGHPNNTGQKPLIIGMAGQVNAQMQYIYRGNYGLVSKEEIMQTGIDEKTAEEMMRLKLSFAFGAIRPSQDLLDSCIVGDDDVYIRDGVIIRRKASNIFEFEYQDASVEVDLNLGNNGSYESAYPLGFQRLNREYFAVVHSGEGDGWDVNRPSMSSILMFQGKVYLIDAGPNLSYNLSALGIGINEIEGIFHTHAHDDHFSGITTLMRSGHKIKYFATPLVRATVEKKIAALLSIEEGRFDDFFDICDLTIDEWHDIEGLEVKPIFSPHPLETTIFLFQTPWGDGYKSYAHFADIVALDVLEKMIEEDPAKPGVTRKYFERIKKEYLTPVNLKKLDIGGGMIHGMAKDFKDDTSDRILLSHVARDLTLEEKEIGSNAPYGMMDVLIASRSDLSRRNAFSFLIGILPDIPVHNVRILINNPVIDFNPGIVILKEGEIPQDIYLILTGAVEKICTSDNIYSHLSSGTMVGDLAGLYGVPSKSTYSTACFIRALQIPVALYKDLIERNNLMPKIEQTWETRSFLESANLFSEGVPSQVLGQIIDSIQIQEFAAGDGIVCTNNARLNVIKSGRVERAIGGKMIETLRPRDFFGEEGAVFDTPCLFHLKALEPVELFTIPGDLIKNIPIVRWKLYEAYIKRAMQFVADTSDDSVFGWNPAFSIQILEIDTHHKKLVEIAGGIVEILRSKGDLDSLEMAFDSLVDYTVYHFAFEEELMARHGYTGVDKHKEKHKYLLSQIRDYKAQLKHEKDLSTLDFKVFFTGWLIKHIMSEDRKYSAVLNAKGVY